MKKIIIILKFVKVMKEIFGTFYRIPRRQIFTARFFVSFVKFGLVFLNINWTLHRVKIIKKLSAHKKLKKRNKAIAVAGSY